MSKLQRIIVMVVAVLVFMVPSAKDAEAAWISPRGYAWNMSCISSTGVKLTVLSVTSSDPDSWDDVPPTKMNFSAYLTLAEGTDEPQIVNGSPPPIWNGLSNVNVTMSFHSSPIGWDYNGDRKKAYFYGSAFLPWSELPHGTTVIVKQTASTIQYVIGNIVC